MTINISKTLKILWEEGLYSFTNKSKSFAKWKAQNAIIHLQKRVIGASEISIDKVRTQNRHDIEYRIAFLNEIDNDTDYQETLYYHFISDPKRSTQEPGQERCEAFVNLVDDIRQNGFQTPITVARYYSSTLNAKMEINGQKNYTRIDNNTGYQLIDGAHRVAAATYLGWDTIPAYIIYPVFFEIPEYSEYIQRREQRYKQLVAEEIDA